MAHEYANHEDLMDRLGIPDGDVRENTLIQAVTGRIAGWRPQVLHGDGDTLLLA